MPANMSILSGKRALVTGAAGFIGANLVRELATRGSEVHGIVRPTTDRWRLRELPSSVALHMADLRHESRLERLISHVGPDLIFHLASGDRLPGSATERLQAIRDTVLATAILLEASASLGYERMVCLGSSLEYGSRNGPLEESQALDPLTSGGVTKAAATILCRQMAVSQSLPLVILRPFHVYGPWESPRKLVPTTITCILDRRPLMLTAPGYRHDFVFVEDVVEACLLCVSSDTSTGDIINIGSGRQVSNEEVVTEIQELMRCQIEVHPGRFPPRPFDRINWTADITKARRLLGWEPRHNLRAGLQKTIDWHRGRREADQTSKGRNRRQ